VEITYLTEKERKVERTRFGEEKREHFYEI